MAKYTVISGRCVYFISFVSVKYYCIWEEILNTKSNMNTNKSHNVKGNAP